jgi:hypothetical protein
MIFYIITKCAEESKGGAGQKAADVSGGFPCTAIAYRNLLRYYTRDAKACEKLSYEAQPKRGLRGPVGFTSGNLQR